MFWERFSDLCNQRNSKPNPVAKEIGVSSGIVSKWKNLGTLPSGETLQKIADYFDCSVDYLLGRTASPSIGSAPAADYSSLEEEHIKKYRLLSQQGKQTVDSLMDNLLLMNGAEPQKKEVQPTALENA